jgi:5-methylcytosine-specific restriction endonuclease McrA
MDGGLCEYCRSVPGEIVHHVIWLTPDNIHDPGIALARDNLRYACRDCHNKIPDPADPEASPVYIWDANGEPVRLR